MDFVNEMKEKARSRPKRLVLPEGTEPGIVKAARVLMDEQLAASVTLLGKVSDIKTVAETNGVSLKDIKIVYPCADENLGKFAREYYELRKHKGMTEDQAREEMSHGKSPDNSRCVK